MKIEDFFAEVGGKFLTKPETLIKKMDLVQGLLFDWDGVFNNGQKSVEYSSSFSEIDSMGINMLRFSLWLATGVVPFTGIITGMINDSALELSKREHFNAVYSNFKSKKEALDHIRDEYYLKPSQLIFIFDDILDISAARHTGVSILIKRTSSPLFNKYVIENKLADYVTGHTGDSNAIREICELILGLKDVYNKVIEKRIAFDDDYKEYLLQRNQISSTFYHKSDKKIIETVI